MGTEAEFKKRQKELMGEWKANALKYSKNLRTIEESWKKLGPFPCELETSEQDVLPMVQNDDIVLWKQHIYESEQQTKSAIERLRYIHRDRKRKRSSPGKALKKSLKKKRVSRKIQLDAIINFLDHFMVLLDNQFAHAELTEQFITLGNHRVAGGELSEENAIKLRNELVALNARWNKLNEETLSLADRVDQFVQDVDKEYKKHALWFTKCDNMDQWLAESEKLIRQQSKVSDEPKELKEQMDDIQAFRKEMRDYQQTASEVMLVGDQIIERNKMDHVDIETTEKITEALRLRWTSIEQHLTNRHDLIITRLRITSKDWSKQDPSPWKDMTEKLQTSLTAAEYKLGSLDEHLEPTADHETLELCTAEIRDVEVQLKNHTNEELSSLSSSSAAWINTKQLTPEGEQKVLDTINELHRKMAQLEEGVTQRRTRIQEICGKRAGDRVEECERTLNDLDNFSMANFSASGASILEVQTQLMEMQKFEARLSEEEGKVSHVRTQYENAAKTGMLDEATATRIGYRLQDLQTQWKELKRENQTSKQRLVAALLLFSRELMGDIYSWLDEAEAQLDAIYVREGDRKALEKAYDKHKEVSDEMGVFEPSIRTAVRLVRKVVDEGLLDEDGGRSYMEEMDVLEKRMDNLRNTADYDEARLKEALERCPPKNDIIDPIVVADVQAEVESTPYMDNDNMPLSDEGFGDADSTSGTEGTKEVNSNKINLKMEEYNLHMRNMHHWIDESESLLNRFKVNMDPEEASRLQRQVDERYCDLDRKETQMDFITKFSRKLEKDLDDPDYTEEIEDELCILLKRWTNIQEALEGATDRVIHRNRKLKGGGDKGNGCCLMVAFRKKMSTMCAYK
ncbi:dystrophin isoform X2 [Nematostella vectensis]|uniref:dystrophin isoform X2 n=1 Tax=Nematostella vectensis TaxID=45351 RepID=UPI00207705E1|nr:dystrophin isoform X2 [Nematostella vectensis]